MRGERAAQAQSGGARWTCTPTHLHYLHKSAPTHTQIYPSISEPPEIRCNLKAGNAQNGWSAYFGRCERAEAGWAMRD